MHEYSFCANAQQNWIPYNWGTKEPHNLISTEGRTYLLQLILTNHWAEYPTKLPRELIPSEISIAFDTSDKPYIKQKVVECLMDTIWNIILISEVKQEKSIFKVLSACLFF
jgi:hypothetical protein